ncbi:hypothetical protein LVJ94_35355 [Pendulispora rubella]|uniref:Uncharacterized protein n=1 Tax=Pendulispora rubella TaxID=2741070 RepID=A0ABZ2KU07_9BACT
MPASDGEQHNADLTNYRLLFGGEVVGFQWTKNTASRSVVLQCLDWSNYWDYAYQWQNTDLFGPGVRALFSGGATNLFTDFLSDEGSIITRIIQTPSAQYPKLKGLLGGLVHLLEAIGGSYYTEKKFAGQNIFFSLAELRLHITQMVTAYEDDPTCSRLLNASGYDALFGRTLGGLGQQVSIRQAINALMAVIFHETYAIPSPRFVPGTAGTVSGQVRRSLAQDPKNGFIAKSAQALVGGLRSLLATLKPAAAGADAAADRAAMVASIQAARNECARTLSQIRDPAVQKTRPFFASALRSLDQARAKAGTASVSRPSQATSGLTDALTEAITQLQRVSEYQITSNRKDAIPARLNAQIFRPDVWFSAPPCCNVLFPDQYTSLRYARSFLQEPTRFLLKTNDEFFGEDELFDQFYFAPKGPSLKKDQATLRSVLSNDLLDHELFSGILPVFEKMGELNIFAARSGTVDGKAPKVGLAQRSANFLYFKYRFAARRLEVSARFNPYVAPGFPGLIIDKYIDSASAKRRAELSAQFGSASPQSATVAGTHFLANFTEVSHAVDQQGGRTEIVGSYARQAEESVEFLGISKSQTVQTKAAQTATRSSDVAALSAPRPMSKGPLGGSIMRATDVTDVYRATDVASGLALPLLADKKRPGAPGGRIRVPVGIAATASAFGRDVVALVGDANALVSFRAYRVEEEIAIGQTKVVDLPAEEYIRPGWYGDIWHPAQITKAYAHFFQTGAITDAIDVATTVGGPNSDSAPALSLGSGASIETAVAWLVDLYSYIRAEGLDVDEFIRSYTWRPIATLADLFGTADLQFSPDGHQVVRGVEGFHSRAFGPFSDLFGLVTPDIDTVLGVKRGSTVAQRGDTRKRKRDAVMDYVTALQFSRAILG